jgi:arylsulfatase A-like enzyme/lysophospholipase L1-like esterase
MAGCQVLRHRRTLADGNPNLDALAKKGVKFWQAYSPAPTCAPSRCAIMSGNHPARAQKTHVVGGNPPAPHHLTAHPMIPPWYSGRMPAGEMTLAKALRQGGYTTGHVGKWHMAINHNAFPQPEDQGFDWTRSDRGVTKPAKPNRLTGFATAKEDDPYHLDQNGFPFDQNNEDALTFLSEKKDNPFFLYYATWLVHTPIHTRSKSLYQKYCAKLGITPDESNANSWTKEGQSNPWYCAMVEQLDYYLGRIFHYLETTDDPRWPGHKLVENTYLIFTSDNGGMEGHPGEIITDNYPLDRGKISIMEGGTRVPLIITGPGIKAGAESDVMINGLDFYPTILSLTGTEKPADKSFDGLDIAPLLKGNPNDPSLVKTAAEKKRDTMVWHFPNSVALESSIRSGDYKLVRNYTPKGENLELFQLYETNDEESKRVDIEEMKNLAALHPEKAKALNNQLTDVLTEMKASYPYLNPNYKGSLAHKEKVPKVTDHQLSGSAATFTYQNNGAKVVRANLLYTDNGGHRYEEWYRVPATLTAEGKVTATLPKGTTHYLINLIDESNFLVSYPDGFKKDQREKKYSEYALKAQAQETGKTGTKSKAKTQALFHHKETLKKDDRIVFLGDSITAAGARQGGYITLASQAIAKAHPDLNIELIGAGIGGHKVPDCQRRLEKDVLQKKPTIVFIYLGINDVWHWTHPRVVARGKKGTTPEDFKNGLKEMIAKINKAGARVILCTPTVIGEKSDGSNPEDKRLDQYSDISRKVARETKSQLLDLRKSFLNQLKNHNPQNATKGIFTSDGVHMNEKGNRLLSQLVLRALKVTAPPKKN